MLWISWQARTQSPPQERICFDHEQVRDQNKCVLRRRLRPCLSWNSKHWSNWFRGVVINHGAWLDHESLLLILSWLRGLRPMCTRMSMDIRVHIGRNQHNISSKTLSTSSLTINAPLIVKDEVDKVSNLSFFRNKKILCGLKAYCYLGPACPGPLKAPTGGSDSYSNRIVII